MSVAIANLFGRRWARAAGYAGLAVVTFVMGTYLMFPYQRLEGWVGAALGDGFEVVHVDIGPGWFPGDVRIRELAVRTRPDKPGEKAVEIQVEELDLDLGLLTLLGGKVDVELEGRMGDGEFVGAVRSSKAGGTAVELKTDSLPLGMLPWVKNVTGGVPLEGGLKAHFRVQLPKGKWKEAQGFLDIACPSCTIGDGVAKIRPMAPGQTNAFSEGGLTLPRLKLGQIGGRIEIAKGAGHIQGFEAKSPDGELYLEGDIRFDDPFSRTQVTAYMRFRSSEELKGREPKMADMETMMGGQARRPDGYLGVSIRGAIGQLRYMPSKVSPVPSSRERATAGAGGPGGRGHTSSVRAMPPGGKPTALGAPPATATPTPPSGEPSGPPVTSSATPSGPAPGDRDGEKPIETVDIDRVGLHRPDKIQAPPPEEAPEPQPERSGDPPQGGGGEEDRPAEPPHEEERPDPPPEGEAHPGPASED